MSSNLGAAVLGLVLVLGLPVADGAGSSPCAQPSAHDGAPDRSLYCIDLVPVPELPGASGAVDLGRARSPFATAVTRDGVLIYDLTVTLAGLPAPAALGPYAAYVAWVTTPDLEPMVRLGVVTNGRTALGPVAFNKFLVLVSAEASPEVTVRRGTLVLRGSSPSMLMRPHDMSLLPAQRPPRPRSPDHAHDRAGNGWRLPPMHRSVPRMIPGLEALEPRV
ncbi:MAG: hypothetical protein ACREKB_12945, partial [Candidatus Rokuibacteriota bacterium]